MRAEILLEDPLELVLREARRLADNGPAEFTDLRLAAMITILSTIGYDIKTRRRSQQTDRVGRLCHDIGERMNQSNKMKTINKT